MKTIKVFLASSSELKEHKEKFQVMIVELNKIYTAKGIYIDLLMWEDLPSINGKEAQQVEYQKHVAESGVFVALFQTRAGVHTKNGIETAYTNHCQSENKRPSVQIYVRTPEKGIEIEESLKEFVKELDEKYTHFYDKYSHIDTLKYKFHVQLEMLETELKLGFTIQSSNLYLNGVEFVSLESLSFATNNLDLIDLKGRLERLKKDIEEHEKNIKEFTSQLAKDPNNEFLKNYLTEFKTKYAKLHSEKRTLEDDIQKHEKSLLDFSLSLAREQSKSSAKWISSALELFEQGDSKGAMALLKEGTKDEDRIISEFDNLRDRTSEKLSELKDKIKGNLLQATGVMTEYDTLERFAQACAFYEKAIELGEGRIDDSEQAWNISTYANFLSHNNQFKESIVHYEKILSIYRSISLTYPKECNTYIANTLNSLALLHQTLNSYNLAEVEYKQALDVYRLLALTNPEAYNKEVAIILNNMGGFHYDLNDYTLAETEFNEALKIHRNLAITNPEAHNADIAMTLSNLGLLHTDLDNYTLAEAEFNEALEMYRPLALNNPKAYNKEVAMTLNNLANLYANLYEFSLAEAVYNEALAIYKALALTNPEAHNPNVSGALHNLGTFYHKFSDYTLADAMYNKALEIRRNSAIINPEAYNADVAMTLNNLGFLHNDLNNYHLAEAELNESLEIRKILALTNPRVYNTDVVASLYCLEDLYIFGLNDLSKAEECCLYALNVYVWLIENISEEDYIPQKHDAIKRLATIIEEQGRKEEADELRKSID